MDTDTLNIVFGIIGTIGTILGIVGIVLTVRSVRKKEPVYSITSVNVISDNVSTYDNLKVTYKGGKIANFTVSKVLLFNRGSETLSRDHIDTLNHLKIVSNTAFNILEATVLQVNNPSSDIRLSFDEANRRVIIDFDYLNHNQGAVIEVIHTGTSSADIDVVGDMKDVKGLIRIPKNLLRNSSSSEGLRRSMSSTALFFMGLTVLIGSTLVTVTSFQDAINLPIGLTRNLGFLVSCLFGFMSIAMIVVIISIVLRRSTVIPEGLEMFDE